MDKRFLNYLIKIGYSKKYLSDLSFIGLKNLYNVEVSARKNIINNKKYA